MYLIGEFSKLSGLSIHTLRYYDKINLLRPASSDPHTAYRYYTHTQLLQSDIIKVCRTVGMELETIKQLFLQADPVVFQQMLAMQQKQLQATIASLQESIFIASAISQRMDVAKNIQAENTFYFRTLRQRTILCAENPQQNADTDTQSAQAYLALIQKLRSNHIPTCYQGGYRYETDGTKVYAPALFEVIAPHTKQADFSCGHIPAGKYLCMCYQQARRSAALEQFLQEVRRQGLTPQFVYDIYLLDGRFQHEARKFELQCLGEP